MGGVFQSPSCDQMYEVTKAINQGAGVLYIYGNYSGDILNFDMATEMAEIEGIKVLSVVGNDDVASSPIGQEHKRRGVAGIFFIFKAAGAAAAATGAAASGGVYTNLPGSAQGAVVSGLPALALLVFCT